MPNQRSTNQVEIIALLRLINPRVVKDEESLPFRASSVFRCPVFRCSIRVVVLHFEYS